MKMRKSLAVSTAGAIAAATLSIVGTTTLSANAATPAVPKGANAAVWKLLPATYKTSKSIQLLRTTTTSPTSGLPAYGGTDAKPTGIEAELNTALAKVLGVKIKVVNHGTDLNANVASVGSSVYPFGQGNTGITKAREQLVHFASYGLAAEDAYVGKSSKLKTAKKITDLCGLKVVSVAGILPTTILNSYDASQTCQKAGKKNWSLTAVSSLATALGGIATGRYDVLFNPENVTNYSKTTGIKDIGSVVGVQVGFFFSHDAKGLALAKAVSAAINVLIKNGTYKKILKKYSSYKGVSGFPITKSVVDPTPLI